MALHQVDIAISQARPVPATPYFQAEADAPVADHGKPRVGVRQPATTRPLLSRAARIGSPISALSRNWP